MTLTYSLQEVAPYINWLYFDYAWNMSGKPKAERLQLRDEAKQRLQQYEHTYTTHAVFQLFNACSDGDDIVVEVRDEKQEVRIERIPCLRQQQANSDFLCLADFIAYKAPDCSRNTSETPSTHTPETKIGLFATTVDAGMECDFNNDPYEKMMMQLLADRLAEATAERMHEEVRKKYWGYASSEQLSIADMLCEQWQGIRPAVGYPSLPDTSMNFLFDRLIDMKQIGIHLTESGAMRPHASVSGMMLSHPQARYFSVGKIGEDQLLDYARRRRIDIGDARRFLSANL